MKDLFPPEEVNRTDDPSIAVQACRFEATKPYTGGWGLEKRKGVQIRESVGFVAEKQNVYTEATRRSDGCAMGPSFVSSSVWYM